MDSDGDEEDCVALLSPKELSFSTTTRTSLIEFDFSVTGMSCVACSNNIENKMHESFDSRGL